jgi:hypothetical protein
LHSLKWGSSRLEKTKLGSICEREHAVTTQNPIYLFFDNYVVIAGYGFTVALFLGFLVTHGHTFISSLKNILQYILSQWLLLSQKYDFFFYTFVQSLLCLFSVSCDLVEWRGIELNVGVGRIFLVGLVFSRSSLFFLFSIEMKFKS